MNWAAEDSDTIARRIAELQRERMAVIAGCNCGPPEPGQSTEVHKPGCPLGPGLPPATPPASLCPAALAILADHRRAVADWAEGDAG